MTDEIYERFDELREQKGVTVYAVSKSTGITTTTFTNWKKGKYTPKQDKLQLIADYFNVPIDYLINGEEGVTKDTYYLNEETAAIAQEIFKNKELKMLFDVSRDAGPEKILAYYNIIKALRDAEQKGDE